MLYGDNKDIDHPVQFGCLNSAPVGCLNNIYTLYLPTSKFQDCGQLLAEKSCSGHTGYLVTSLYICYGPLKTRDWLFKALQDLVAMIQYVSQMMTT